MAYLGNQPVVGDSANTFKLLDDISSFTLTFDGSSASVVSVANDTLTFANHRFVTGQRVTYGKGGGTVITGLTDATAYFIIKVDQNTIKLATNASNAASSTAIDLTGLGAGTSHTLKVAFDGVNTKFKATHTSGIKSKISRAAQISLSINGVIQQPQDTSSPTVGYGVEADSTIVFSTAPVATDKVFGSFIGEVAPSFDLTDNTVDNFTGDGSTTTFTLSRETPSSQDVLVTLDGVTQYPSDASTTRSYSVVNQALTFTSAPANGVAIQARHIGFAGATTSEVTGFYGRTGNVALTSTDDISVSNVSAGIITATTFGGNPSFTGSVSIGGTLTYEDVTNIDSVGLITARNGIVVGSGITLSKDGNIFATGISTFGGNIQLSGTNPEIELNSGGPRFRVPASNTLSIFTSGGLGSTSDERFRISSDGKVGIGTDTPHVTGLSVHGANSRFQLTSPTTGGASGDGVIFGLNGDQDFFINNREASKNLLFFTASAERLRITSDGNIYTDGDQVRDDARLTITNNVVGVSTSLFLHNANGSGTATKIAASKAIIISADAEANTPADKSFISLHTDNSERLRIDSNGMIGFGGVTPKTQNSLDAIEFGLGGLLGSQRSARTVEITSNAYYNSGWKYMANDVATQYYQYNGYHAFTTATSGSADAAISFSEKLRITSAGRVGIGENSPDALLHLSTGASTTCELRLQSNNTGSGAGDRGRISVYSALNNGTEYQAGYIDIDRSSGTDDIAHLLVALNDGSSVAERIRITGSGQLLLGKTSSSNAVHLLQLEADGTSSCNGRITTTGMADNADLGWSAGASNRDANFGIFKNSTNNPGSYMRMDTEDDTTTYAWFDNSRIFRCSGAYQDIGKAVGNVIGAQSSDIRLKDLVGDGSVSYGLSEINQITPIKFTYKKDPRTGLEISNGDVIKTRIGFSAQQVKPIIPEAVYDTGEQVEGEDNIMAMEYVNLIPALVNAVKELSAKNDALEAEITALKG